MTSTLFYETISEYISTIGIDIPLSFLDSFDGMYTLSCKYYRVYKHTKCSLTFEPSRVP